MVDTVLISGSFIVGVVGGVHLAAAKDVEFVQFQQITCLVVAIHSESVAVDDFHLWIQVECSVDCLIERLVAWFAGLVVDVDGHPQGATFADARDIVAIGVNAIASGVLK